MPREGSGRRAAGVGVVAGGRVLDRLEVREDRGAGEDRAHLAFDLLAEVVATLHRPLAGDEDVHVDEADGAGLARPHGVEVDAAGPVAGEERLEGRLLPLGDRLVEEAVGRLDAAALAYESAAQAWPAESLPQFALANLAYARGDLAGAERGFHAAVRLNPQDAAARNNRAEALRALGCPTLARREIEVARVLAAGGPLSATVEATARAIASHENGDVAGCPPD